MNSLEKPRRRKPVGTAVTSPAIADSRLRDLIGYRIRVLNTLLTQHSKLLSTNTLDLTLAQWRVLHQLGIRGDTNPKLVAEGTGMERSHVTHAISTLLERRLVSRVADASDGRSVLLSLTAGGRALLKKGVAATAERRTLLENALTDEERNAFNSALTKLTAVAEELLSRAGESK